MHHGVEPVNVVPQEKVGHLEGSKEELGGEIVDLENVGSILEDHAVVEGDHQISPTGYPLHL